MSLNLSGAIWFWCLRLVALLYVIQLVFHVAVPELILGVSLVRFSILLDRDHHRAERAAAVTARKQKPFAQGKGFAAGFYSL